MLKHRIFSSSNSAPSQSGSAPRFLIVCAFFFVGCVLGAFFGSNFSTTVLSERSLLDLYTLERGMLWFIFTYIWLHIFAVLLGTSFLGVVFVPVLTLLKGFVFSCTSATIISAYPSRGIIMALVILGVPSLFSIPSFIALSDNALFRSAKLLALLRGDHGAFMKKSDVKIFLCIPVLVLGLIAAWKLVPYLTVLIG